MTAGQDDGGDGLRLTDAAQAAAIGRAIFNIGRGTGLGRARAAVMGEAAVRHLPGQLAQHGLRLRVEWVSADAREVAEQAWRAYDPPDLPAAF